MRRLFLTTLSCVRCRPISGIPGPSHVQNRSERAAFWPVSFFRAWQWLFLVIFLSIPHKIQIKNTDVWRPFFFCVVFNKAARVIFLLTIGC
jgi:hypothetical protein